MQVLYFDFDLGGSLIFFVCVNSAWIVYEQMDVSLKSHTLCENKEGSSVGRAKHVAKECCRKPFLVSLTC